MNRHTARLSTWGFLLAGLWGTASALVCAQAPLADLPLPAPPPQEVQMETVEFGDELQGTLQHSNLVLDIETLVDLVTNKNLDVALSNNEIRIAKAQYLQSFSPLLPSISTQYSKEQFEGGEVFFGPVPISLDRTTYRPTLSAEYEVQTGGRTIFNIRAAKARLLVSENYRDQSFQTTLLEVLTTYFTWLEETAQHQLALQSLAEADVQVQYNESRIKAGFGTELELLQAKTIQAEQEGLVLRTRNQRNVTEFKLISQLNLPLSAQLASGNIQLNRYRFVDESLTLEKMFAIASENRADIKALNERINEAKARYAVARSALFPTLSVSGYIRGIGPELDGLQRTEQGIFVADMDLLRNMGLDTLSRMKMEKANIEKTILTKERELGAIKETLAKAFYDWQYYRAQMEVVNKKVQSTTEAYRIAQARYHSQIGLNNL